MTIEEWLDGNELSIKIWNNKYRHENEDFEQWLDRVSGGNKDVRKLILEKKFLFGGRTLSNRGTNRGSYSNCYSSGFCPDSLSEIMDLAKDLALTYKSQGGQGVSLSKIRPKGTKIANGFESDGIVPFMEIFNKVTESISQGGCIYEKELVLTNKGLIPIKDINIGDKVWTKNGYISVNYKWNKGISDIYEVTLKSGLKIRTTLDHKFNIDGFNGKPLKELKIGDNVISILGDSENNSIFNTEAYVLGTFLANGTINKKRNSGNISFCANIPTGKTIVYNYLKDLTKDIPSVYEKDKYYRIALSKKAILMLNYFKSSTKNISIPDRIMNNSIDIKLSFLAGLLDTDGCVYCNAFKYNTISETFANQLMILLNSIGFIPKLSCCFRENKEPLYEIYCSVFKNSPKIPSYKCTKNLIDFVKNCKNSTPFTIDNLGIVNRTGHLKKLSKCDKIGYYTYINECSEYYKPCILEEIVSIKKWGIGHVYDISLESEHFFSCNGFYVSNSRKGALLMSLDVWHKEIENFITIKKDPNKIQKANLSVEIDDEFMKNISTDKDIEITRTYEDKEIHYTINPNKIYNLICESALKSAEPGVIFTNRFRNYNLMEFVDDYQIETCNPCGEQPLIKSGSCNLSSINVSEYVHSPFTSSANWDWSELQKDIKVIVRAMDDVLEENLPNHALEKQKEMVRKYRNCGIGIMGLHDAFIKMGIVYGSTSSIDKTRELMNFIFNAALSASIKLGKERGNFPGYSPKIWDSTIIKENVPIDNIEKYKKLNTLRNCSLLSIAPCGSISTMLNVSSGIEPWFALHYTRNTKSLEKDKETSFEVWAPIAKQANSLKWHPECLVTSNDISWKQHIDIQAVAQKAVDTAISKTINMPKGTTLEDVKQLYLYAWKSGLKGCTIYVNGSRDPILTTTLKEEKRSIENPNTRGYIVKADDNCIGLKRTLTTGCGTLHVTSYFDPITGDLRETYLSKGSTGGCNNFMIGLSRMISLAARGGVKLDDILDQLKSCGTCPSYAVRNAIKHDTSKGSCCPVAVGNALKDMAAEVKVGIRRPIIIDKPKVQIDTMIKLEECPECHEKTLIREAGCRSCSNCGWSACE